MKTKPFSIQKPIDVETVRNLLCCAFEGGSNYWYFIEDKSYPAGLGAKDYAEGGKGQDGPSYWHWCELLPTQEGGSLTITCKEGDEVNGAKAWTLDRAAIQRGLGIMAEKYPRHFASVLDENEDAETGDVFLQCCLFGEIIFG